MHHSRNSTHQQQDVRTLCSHSFSETRRCGSPALRGESFCYYHHPTRQRLANPYDRKEQRLARRQFTLPLPTTRAELQHSLCLLMHLIPNNQIDTRRAGLLLLALQTAGKTLGG